MTISDEDERVIFEIAFAIEDPAGLDSVILARELLFFSRRVRAEHRRSVASFFARTSIGELGNVEIDNLRNETDELPKMRN